MKNDNDLNFDFIDPRKWRWILVLLCILSFSLAFKMTAYGVEITDSALVSYEQAENGDRLISFDYSTSKYNFTIQGVPEDFKNYVFYRHYLSSSASAVSYIYMIFLGPDSNYYYSEESGTLNFTNYYYADFRVYAGGEHTEIIECKSMYPSGYVAWAPSYGDRLEACNVDILTEDGDGFFTTPLPSMWEGVTLTNPLTEVLGILPLILIAILGWLGLRKALKVLYQILKNS